MSFKEVVTMFAERSGMTLLPKVGMRVCGGKQVYVFGDSVRVYLDQGVAYAYDDAEGGGGQWEPVALETLLDRAKAHVPAVPGGGRTGKAQKKHVGSKAAKAAKGKQAAAAAAAASAAAAANVGFDDGMD